MPIYKIDIANEFKRKIVRKALEKEGVKIQVENNDSLEVTWTTPEEESKYIKIVNKTMRELKQP
jgi:hypothetical protein